jgi:hypothetical protein
MAVATRSHNSCTTANLDRKGWQSGMVDFPLLVFVVSFAMLVVAAWVGDFLRKRSKSSAEANRDDSGVVLAGTLTLLGLIIGFSFSMATSRYDLRKNAEQVEANAVAVLYMRADLLPPADAAKVHQMVKNYLDQRIAFYSTRDRSQLDRIDDETGQIEKDLWSTIEAAVEPLPPQLEGLFISATNDLVVSQLSTRAVWVNRIPTGAWVLIVVTSIGCNFLIGYRARQTDWLVFLVMPVAVSISLFLIADLDSARGGGIRVRPNNLIGLSQSLGSRVP